MIARPLGELPHHDGSPDYLPIGTRPDILFPAVRVPVGWNVERVQLRWCPDAEPRFVDAALVGSDDEACWWRAELPLTNAVTRYRFLLSGPDGDHWLNAAGLHLTDVTDAADFVVSSHEPPPAWVPGSVGYQIFPDRFARGGIDSPEADWAVPAEWDDSVATDPRVAVHQVFGGDLGIESRLDHLSRLGVDLLYLTPVFPARSSHRYDASSFDTVDPLLGGDDAYTSLIAACHRRGIKVIGDLTLNHVGNHHQWFRRAQDDPDAVEASFFYFEEHPDRYRSWYGVPTLPKLDHRSTELRKRLIDGPDSVVARWLQPSDGAEGLDGWRIDCANVTGRLEHLDLNAEVARTVRRTMAATKPEAWLLAEHNYDASADLAGDGWHGTMAYHWFTVPVWNWLAAPGDYDTLSRRSGYGGDVMAASIRQLMAGTPWSAITASMTLLDSHDCARFRSVAASAERHLAGMTMLLTFPGVPVIFAGSELGVTGSDMNQARVPFPWDAEWDTDFLADVTSLIELRRRNTVLQLGSLRWIQASQDSVTFLRELDDERWLVHVARDAHDPVELTGLGGGSWQPEFGDLRLEDGMVGAPRAGGWVWRSVR
ncbi:MAG: glycoside hydrolase family 13 protein [Ilumatobacteraceae bacterium]